MVYFNKLYTCTILYHDTVLLSNTAPTTAFNIVILAPEYHLGAEKIHSLHIINFSIHALSHAVGKAGGRAAVKTITTGQEQFSG